MRFVVPSMMVLAACASSKPEAGPPPLEVSSTGVPGQAAGTRRSGITATVLAVDHSGRRLTLRGEDGNTETISVPPNVTRFNEILADDTIEVELQEGVLFEYQPAGTAFVTPRGVVGTRHTGANELPGAAAAVALQATVVVIQIDLKTRLVRFQDPDGNKYQVKADPHLPIEKLEIGDRLLATYVAKVAIALDRRANQ